MTAHIFPHTHNETNNLPRITVLVDGHGVDTVLKKVEIQDLDGLRSKQSLLFSQSRLPVIQEGTDSDVPKPKIRFTGSMKDVTIGPDLPSSSVPKRSLQPKVRFSILIKEIKDSLFERTRKAVIVAKDKKKGKVVKPDLLPRFNLVPTSLATNITQRMNKCKWCYKQCQNQSGKECTDCIARRCNMVPKPAASTTCSKKVKKKKKKKQVMPCEESESETSETDCKKVCLGQWDSSIAWNRRMELERRLVRNLPALEKSRRETTAERRREVSVIIVGAGMAGLSASDSLLSNGFKNVTVLEASNRIGGRVRTDSFGPDPQSLVELGVPEVDHPEEWNAVLTLTQTQSQRRINGQDTPASTDTKRGQLSKLVPQCSLMSAKCVDRQACFYKTMINHEMDTLAQLQSSDNNNNLIQLASKDYFRESLRRIDKHGISCDKNVHQHIICPGVTSAVEAYCKEVQYRHGDDKGDADIQYFTTTGSTRTHSLDMTLSGGMVSLIQPLTKLFKSKTLKLKTKVKHIDWSDFTTGSKRNRKEPQRVTVECSDGRVFKSRHLILAVPLGFLKANARSLFCPALPDNKLRAIERLGFGGICKAFIWYESDVGNDGVDIKLAAGDRDIVSEYNLEEIIVNITAKPKSCIVQVTFSNSTPEKLNDEDLMKDLTRILERSLQKTMPEVVKFVKTNWKNNSLYKGTHPYIKATASGKEIDNLAQPLALGSNMAIQFAGDATHGDYTCLLHAARASGLREAQRLINIYDDQHEVQNLN